ncbi:MAG: dinucleotide-utilizing enzyme [Microbacterium sp.]
MPTTRLSRSLPFWVLVGGSVVSIAGGTYLLMSKLLLMESTLTDGTATGVEVYAGQIWAVLGSILVGAGLIGLALALALVALRSPAAPAAPAAPAEDVVEPPAWVEDDSDDEVEPISAAAEDAADDADFASDFVDEAETTEADEAETKTDALRS